MAIATDPLLDAFSDAEIVALAYDWQTWQRPEQAEPDGDWLIWLILTGRGWGKNRTAGETIRAWVNSGRARRLHLIARTAADARDTMVEGEGGLLDVCSGDIGNRPVYKPSLRRIEWPNGAKAVLFSAEEPDVLRGPQCDGWWADELASWKYLQATWDNLQMGARLGNPRGIITTTPRPVKILTELVDDSNVYVTRGSTFENEANLSPAAMAWLRKKYIGTRLGRQELDGEILSDNPGALWQRANIDATRVSDFPEMPLVVVAIDPAITSNESSDETGIVVCGLGSDGQFYVLADNSLRGTPHAWAVEAVSAYHKHKADRIVYESNQGGEMVGSTIATVDPRVPLQAVHASRGKRVRAEPIAALYEQGRVHHVGAFPELEDQLCDWEPGNDSPDRLDALVWAISAILSGGDPKEEVVTMNAIQTFGGIVTGGWE